jgi:hypothetical protein
MPTPVSKRVGLGAAAAVGPAVVGAAALRLRLLDVPLDRDEGEYAYIGQLLLQGIPPYAQAYNFKLPGIYGGARRRHRFLSRRVSLGRVAES